MAKTVFGSHIQTAHVWAQGRHPRGRSSDGRMFFEGRILYSYGHHFALGLVVLGLDGNPTATLLNSSKYSVSTGKHKGHAWHAARGRTIHVPELTDIAEGLQMATSPIVGRDVLKAQRPAVEQHIAKHFAEYEDDSAAFVLELVGGTAKQAAAIRAKAAKAAATKAAAEAKAAAKAQLTKALERAKWSRDELLSWARLNVLNRAPYMAEHEAKAMLKDLRALHRAASAAGKDKAKKALWAHVKTLEAFPALAAARVAAKIEPRRSAVKVVRQYLANAAAEAPLPLKAAQWRRVYEAAQMVAGFTWSRGLERAATDLANHAALERERTAAEETAAANAARLERARIAQLEEAERKTLWLTGNPSAQWHGRTPEGGAYLRATHVERDDSGTITGGTLETSQGAEVPLTHALRAFRFLKLCRTQGQAWQANGRTIPVGHFRIDRVEPNGDFRAGCHFIQWDQVESLAARLGVLELAPDESAVVVTDHA